jgi:hypothetical protein
MLTLQELQAAKINPAVAREAYVQADRHLVDILDVRKSFEQKASTLMGAYNTLSLALFGLGATIFKDAHTLREMAPFLGAGAVFFVGTLCFLTAIRSGEYPALGSTPEMWLNAGTIDGEDNAVAAMLAYITFHHSTRIDLCNASNKRKARWINFGIYLGPVAPIAFLALFFVY